MTSSDFADLSVERYLLVTTFRSSGEPVSTPVWAVEGLGGLLVTTSGASGKVKRIRKNPAVLLAACDVHGVVAPGATQIHGIATVLDDAESRVVIDAALERKYGERYAAIRAAGALRQTSTASSVVVRIVTAV